MSDPRFSFVARVDGADPDPSTSVGWRLLGRNNHEMARSAAGFDDVPVAVSGRAYRREREAAQSVEHFIEVAPEALVPESLNGRPAPKRLARPHLVVRRTERVEPGDDPRGQDWQHLDDVRELADQEIAEASSSERRAFTSASPDVRRDGPTS